MAGRPVGKDLPKKAPDSHDRQIFHDDLSTIPMPLNDCTAQNHDLSISCSTYPASLSPSSVPQDLNGLHPPPPALTGYHNHSRSHVSLPSPITTDLHPRILERTESDSPDRAEPEGDVASLTVGATLSNPKIRPFVPESLQRYERNVKVPKEYTEYTIPAVTTTFDMPNNPLGWTPCFHPEGALYFFHEGKRIFTDANLYEADMLSQIEANIDTIDEFFRVHNIRRSVHVDLVLELLRVDGQIDTLYYMVDHSKRCIFFVDDFDASDLPIWYELQGVTSPTHVKHEIETQYWTKQRYHCLMFPRSIELSQDLVDELRDIIIHSLGENVDSKFQGSTCLLSDALTPVRQRFYNFHGQSGARMGRDQSVYGTAQNKRSWLILSLSPMLFFSPEVHLQTLEKMWIDGITRRVLWTEFMDKLYAEWQEFTLYGTVLLNANVAFLAIQSVDERRGNSRSPAQIASYASIAASLGTIILGLLLVRQTRSKGRDNATDASTYLHKRSNQAMGIETLAIMYSLPYALLMWGMVCFLFAFLFICFDGSDIYTRLLVGATWVAIASLIMCCIWMAWEQMPETGAETPEPVAKADSRENPTEENAVSKAFGISWGWRALVFRRDSRDSERTVV
ncbi:hypothetical protein FPV67DRAFT_1448735 [Lyophyllum atratum]|nr:hypothetical protein FPV67DRAFT_1448735 [Lyophyllum atratum]